MLVTPWTKKSQGLHKIRYSALRDVREGTAQAIRTDNLLRENPKLIHQHSMLLDNVSNDLTSVNHLTADMSTELTVEGVINNAQQHRRSATVGSSSSGQAQALFDPPAVFSSLEPSTGSAGKNIAQMLNMEGSESG